MSKNRRLFTSESVTEGHPDKICDQISDSILDAILKNDPNARVACETSVTTGLVLVTGEITTTTYVDISKIVRETLQISAIQEQNMALMLKRVLSLHRLMNNRLISPQVSIKLWKRVKAECQMKKLKQLVQGTKG